MAGFQTKRNNLHLIKDIRKNTRQLRPQNINETVDEFRRSWNRYSAECKIDLIENKEELLQPYKHKILFPFERDEIGIVPFHVGVGFWELLINENNSGNREFSFCVKLGSGWTESSYHPSIVQRTINHFDQSTQREFKKLVMEDWKSSCKTLLDIAQSVLPGYKTWSVTCCEKSTNLLKQIKDDRLITQNPGVSFLLL